MLTIEDIVQLYQEDLIISFKKFKRKSGPKTLTGEYNTEKHCDNSYYPPEIFIYENQIKSQKDLDITLLHEFIHAKNDLILNLDIEKENDEKVEEKAQKIYKKAPEIVEFIKEFFRLKKLDFNP